MLSEVQEQPEGVRFLSRVVDGGLTSPLLLVGPQGVGRKFSVLETAKETFTKASGDDFHCFQIDKGAHPDVHILAPTGDKEIGVDSVRKIVEEAQSFPSLVPSRFVVVDGADRLTNAAANAILKTLEEPPETTRFFLLAESYTDVIPTIRSRCGLVRYYPLSEALIVGKLSTLTSNPTQSLTYARLSNGSIGRAVQYFGSGRLAIRDQMLGLLQSGLQGDLSSLFPGVDAIDDLKTGLHFLEHLLRDLAMIPFDTQRLSNLDKAAEIAELRNSLGDTRLRKLVRGFDGILNSRNANVPFHLKTLLADTFVG